MIKEKKEKSGIRYTGMKKGIKVVRAIEILIFTNFIGPIW